MLTSSVIVFASLLVVATGIDLQEPSRELSGVVLDAQGGVIVGAAVDIVCGGHRRQLSISPSGEFAAANLPRVRCRRLRAGTCSNPRRCPSTHMAPRAPHRPADPKVRV
jgi:hypothetical protein